MFDSNIYSNKKEFHGFYSDDIAFQAVGISSYTVSSLSGLLTRASDPETSDFFNGQTSELYDKMTMNGSYANGGEPAILKFNTETKKYELEKGNDILLSKDRTQAAPNFRELLEKHNKNQSGLNVDQKVAEVVRKIQTSYSGGIVFRIEFTAAGSSRTAQIKTTLTDRFSDHGKSRTVAQKDSPLIAGVPTRSTGSAYGHRGTQDAPVGVYQKPDAGGVDNPKNTIAAPLDIKYNSSTGKWESGTTQMLARLLTDVDPASFNDFYLEKDTVDNVSSSDFYNVDSANYLGQFTTGMAMPLSVENGNPFTFGPNLIGCSNPNGTTKVEKIMVVNRAPRAFKKGDVVMCSHLGNEWILQGFDAGVISKPKGKFGKWQFQKYIATSDNFMVYSLNSQQQVLSNPKNIESTIRIQYYKDMMSGAGDSSSPNPLSTPSLTYLNSLYPDYLNKIAKLNLAQSPEEADIDKTKLDWEKTWENLANSSALPGYPNLDLQIRPIRSTIFDQLGIHMGGLNTKNLVGRTNITYSPDGRPVDEAIKKAYAKSIPFFWGPVLPEGYSTAKIQNMKSNPLAMSVKGKPGFLSDADGTKIFSKDAAQNALKDSGNYMFSDLADGNAKQLPAEVALNGSVNSQYSYPIENNLWYAYVNNYVDSIDSFVKSNERFTYLTTPDGKDAYGLTPINPGLIQFSPLSIETALYHTESTNSEFNTLKNAIDEMKALFDGNQNILVDSVKGRENLEQINDGNGTKYLIRFNKFNANQKRPAPVGGPNILPIVEDAEKSNVVGIIAAKNKFSAPSNGQLTLSAKQYFGLGPKVTVGGSSSLALNFIGAFIGWSTGGNSISQNSFPQWGDRSRTDGISSFGTTALHFRLFDQWPDHQTIFDGRYFTVTHINPFPTIESRSGVLSESSRYSLDTATDVITFTDNGNKYYVAETPVDLRVPTYPNGTPIPLDTLIESGTAVRPISAGFINTVRRGRLVSNGGFRYYYPVIGLDDQQKTKLTGGSNFTANQLVRCDKGVIIKVKSVATEGTNDGAISDFEFIQHGEGFEPINFAVKTIFTPQGGQQTEYIGYPLTIPSTNGVPAKFIIPKGKVRLKLGFDSGPTERVSMKRLTSPSDDGKKSIESVLDTTVQINGGNGKYDGFYFFHNDILHTLTTETPYTAGLAQYVTLEASTS